jgi:hypothetical protein
MVLSYILTPAYTTNGGSREWETKKSALTSVRPLRHMRSRSFWRLFFTLGEDQGLVRGSSGPSKTPTHPLPDATARRGAPVGLQYGLTRSSILALRIDAPGPTVGVPGLPHPILATAESTVPYKLFSGEDHIDLTC